MARPRKYSKRELAEAVARYFDSISRMVPVMERVETDRRDDKGHVIYEKKPVLNRLDQPAMIEEFIVPPTIGGLCQFLGIHRSTWAEYCSKDEFSDTTTRAGGRIRAYLEQQLLVRKDVKGIIFDLQNNHGYSEKRHLEFGPNANKAISTAGMSIGERKALLEQIGREFMPGGDGDEQAEQ